MSTTDLIRARNKDEVLEGVLTRVFELEAMRLRDPKWRRMILPAVPIIGIPSAFLFTIIPRSSYLGAAVLAGLVSGTIGALVFAELARLFSRSPEERQLRRRLSSEFPDYPKRLWSKTPPNDGRTRLPDKFGVGNQSLGRLFGFYQAIERQKLEDRPFWRAYTATFELGERRTLFNEQAAAMERELTKSAPALTLDELFCGASFDDKAWSFEPKSDDNCDYGLRSWHEVDAFQNLRKLAQEELKRRKLDPLDDSFCPRCGLRFEKSFEPVFSECDRWNVSTGYYVCQECKEGRHSAPEPRHGFTRRYW